MTVKYIDPGALCKPYGFRHVAIMGGYGTAWCAGQASVDRDGRVLGIRDYETQAYHALYNVAIALRAGGGDCKQLLQLTVFVVDLGSEMVEKQVFRGLARASREEGIEPGPSAMIGVQCLMHPDALIEIMAVAALKNNLVPVK